VFTWGRGKYGQLGLGATANAAAPARVIALQEVASRLTLNPKPETLNPKP